MIDGYETKDIKATKTKRNFEPVAPKAAPAPVEVPTQNGIIWEERGPTFKFKMNGNIYTYSSKNKAEEGLKLLNGEG